MALSLSKAYTPSSGQISDSAAYNTDIAALFNALNGLEAQTSTLGGLTITPSADGVIKFRITNAAGTELFSVDTTNSAVKLKATAKLYLDGGSDSYIHENSGNNIQIVANSTTIAQYRTTNINWAVLGFADAGIRYGVDSTDNDLSHATSGSGSATLYIGNKTIDTSVSDGRYKIVLNESKNALDTLNKLDVVDYQWKPDHDKDQRIHIGMIAQDVAKINECFAKKPENEDTGLWKLELQELLCLCIKSIQELYTKIEEVK